MFKNYLKVALRNLSRHKFYSIINIAGLAVGLAGFIMIGMWVQDELSYDRHFKNADRIYRIANDLVTSGVPSPWACADPRVAEHLREDYPEIEQVARIVNISSLLSYRGRHFYEPSTYYADSTFFKIFDYDFIRGSSITALRAKNGVVVTETMAKKLFGNEDPVGKIITINNDHAKDGTTPYFITAVIRDHHYRAHFNPEVIIAKTQIMEQFEHTYALFAKGYAPQRFEIQVWPQLYQKYFREEYKADKQGLNLDLQPLTSIHLTSHRVYELEPTGRMEYIYIFSFVAFFLLLIAAINYMNLATARSYGRSKEVGVRKVLGASRNRLIIQFLTESVTMSLLALFVALTIVEVSLPFFNKIADKKLSLDLLQPAPLITVLLLALVTGLISGAYPAFFISSFLPIKALKGTLETGRHRFGLRKSLVIIQFTLSIVMLIATMVVSKQLKYVRKVDLGFNKNEVLFLNLDDPAMKSNTEVVKAELLKNPAIINVAASHNIPGGQLYNFYFKFETPTGLVPRLITTMLVDYDYLNLMGFTLSEGVGFDKTMMSRLDSTIFIIANNSATKFLEWQNPVGKIVERGSSVYKRKTGKCIGVVKDFHTASLHDEIPPMIFSLTRKDFNFLSVKISPQNVPHTLAYIEKVWKTFSSGYPLEYHFLDEHFNKQYQKEDQENILFALFASLCIFISCLGLMGLASFSTQQRTKEIGIRKISGAEVFDIVFLLSKDFVILVVISIGIAIPIGWYLMDKWLEGFAYHTDIGWFVFLAPSVLAVLIALLTVSFHTVRAANKNPALVLKYE